MDWLQITQSLGIPAAILIAMGLGIYRAAVWCGMRVEESVVWLGKEVVIPVRNQHFETMADMRAVAKAIDARLASLESGVGEVKLGLRSVILRPPPGGSVEIHTEQRGTG